jgi:hypothetical protein
MLKPVPKCATLSPYSFLRRYLILVEAGTLKSAKFLANKHTHVNIFNLFLSPSLPLSLCVFLSFCHSVLLSVTYHMYYVIYNI